MHGTILHGILPALTHVEGRAAGQRGYLWHHDVYVVQTTANESSRGFRIGPLRVRREPAPFCPGILERL